jgi:hypothetical protein
MDNFARPLKVRPHHLLCILGFRGLGYDEEFVSNMTKLVEKLHADSTLPITLVVGGDAICAACPHSKGGKCLKRADSEAEVTILDSKVLKRLGFEVGVQIPAGEAWERVRERLTSEDLTEICVDCEWLGLGYCVEGLRRSKTRS